MVLSLDGGGVRGYLTAKILENLEAVLNKLTGKEAPIGQRFDFIAGTSTGGIIAMGLATGRTAAEIFGFYENLIPKVFNPKQATWNPYWWPKYQSDILRRELEVLFKDPGTKKDLTLEDVSTHVCITGVSLSNGQPRFHKSYYRPEHWDRLKETLANVALATCAAPTYFPAHTLDKSTNVIDGGICANNPSVVAISDAPRFKVPSRRGTPPPRLSDIVLLSVGTGFQPSMPYDPNRLAQAGLLDWARNIAEVMFESQSWVAHYQSEYLLGADNYLRINPKLDFPLMLDDADPAHLKALKNLASVTHIYNDFLERHFR